MLTAQVTVDDCTFELDILVVLDELLGNDVLLGRDALCHKDKRLVIENDSCWFEKAGNVAALESNLVEEDCAKLKMLLTGNRKCFAESAKELGRCTLSKMEIKLTSNTPINCRPYRISFALREKVNSDLKELLQANIIRKSDSPYASPMVVVPKKNGENRICIDYSKLNSITEKVSFPMPIIEEQLALLAGNKYYTSLDLRMGYHQIEIAEASKKYTAFITVDGHYEYNRMPFGLVNAPAVFQAVMNAVAAKMEPGEIMTYLDYVILPSQTVQAGLKILVKFLRIIREVGLTLRMEKCNILQKLIQYLAHTIDENGISPGEHKINAIRNFGILKDVTEIRRFLGLTSFFRRFIHDYSLITKPLTTLLHKSEVNNFCWGEAQQKAFGKLVEVLCEKPVLALYDFRALHEVHTDASRVG